MIPNEMPIENSTQDSENKFSDKRNKKKHIVRTSILLLTHLLIMFDLWCIGLPMGFVMFAEIERTGKWGQILIYALSLFLINLSFKFIKSDLIRDLLYFTATLLLVIHWLVVGEKTFNFDIRHIQSILLAASPFLITVILQVLGIIYRLYKTIKKEKRLSNKILTVTITLVIVFTIMTLVSEVLNWKINLNLPSKNIYSKMIYIKGGTFIMGSKMSNNEKPEHEVSVSDFYMGKYEVTVKEFKRFIEETGYITEAEKSFNSTVLADTDWKVVFDAYWKNPYFKQRGNHPVVCVSWSDAVRYCKWLSKRTGKRFRLPTEAEWEYAAGNGENRTKYSWGQDNPTVKDGGNIADESARKKYTQKKPQNGYAEGYDDGFECTSPVGSFNPNKFGLYDMTGNVWEWCSDLFSDSYYKESPKENPTGPLYGIRKALRGGSWFSGLFNSRVTFRRHSERKRSYSDCGFRVVMEVK